MYHSSQKCSVVLAMISKVQLPFMETIYTWFHCGLFAGVVAGTACGPATDGRLLVCIGSVTPTEFACCLADSIDPHSARNQQWWQGASLVQLAEAQG